MDYFAGQLCGYSVKDLYEKIDYSKSSLKERQEIVNNIMETGFFEDYFDNVYNPCKNKNHVLSEEDNVCRLLENLGSYLLNSDELRDDIKTYDTKGLISKINRNEENIEGISQGTDEGLILHNLQLNKVGAMSKDRSFKLSNLSSEEIEYYSQFLTKEDQRIIDSYWNYYNTIDASNLNRRQKNLHKFRIKQDIETVFQGLQEYKHDNLNIGSDQQFLEYYDIQPDDLKHRHILTGVSFEARKNRIERTEGLLFECISDEGAIDNNLHLTKISLDNIIDMSGLIKEEEMVLEKTREGMRVKDIAKILNISNGMVSKHKRNIVNKVRKTIEENKGEI